MTEQFREVGVAVCVAFSLHGGFNCDEWNWEHHQVSGQRLHTECVGNSSLSYGNIRGTRLVRR